MPNEFNANGISTTPNGRALLVVQSFTGKLFRVNPRTGRAGRVRLGGYPLTNGDGLLREVAPCTSRRTRTTRWPCSGSASAAGPATSSGRSGLPSFDVPTTIARDGRASTCPTRGSHAAHADDEVLDHPASTADHAQTGTFSVATYPSSLLPVTLAICSE